MLGTAQDYDRTSFEVDVESLEFEAGAQSSPLVTAAAAAADVVMAATETAPTIHNTSTASTASSSAAAVRTRDSRANFRGIWRRSHGFNWAALLEFSGVDKAAIPEQVRSTR